MVVSDHLAFPPPSWPGCSSAPSRFPVSTMLRAPEVAVLVADSEATVVVVSGRHAAMLPQITSAAPSVQAAVVAGEGQGESQGAGEAGGSDPGLAVPLYSLSRLCGRVPGAARADQPGQRRLLAVHVGDDRKAEGRHPPPR